MPAFTFPSPGVTSYSSPPELDSHTKLIDTNASDRIGELQKFLLGSDWSSLSSLSPPTAPVHAVADVSGSWLTSAHNLPLFSSSVETIKPSTMLNANVNAIDTTATVPEAHQNVATTSESAFAATTTAHSVPAPVSSTASYPSALTPSHRQSFDTCYSDSVGSPDSERDFLTSPSLFDDADFEFDADTLAFPLFNDHPFEDPVDSPAEDPVDAFASNLENVKLEVGEQDSQLTETETDFGASQSTVMPSQSQVKLEHEDVYESSSTLDGAFKTEADSAKFEAKDEDEMWTSQDLKPYFGDDADTKAAVLSTLANAYAFGHDLSQSIKKPVVQEVAHEQEQQPSQVGPIRSSRGDRERRSSPTKTAVVSDSPIPAPFIDPVTNAKRWQCDECGKLFDRAYNLKTHRYTHEDPETRARPFECPDAECQKQFARKHDMQRHFENVHRGESRGRRGGSVKRSRADDLG